MNDLAISLASRSGASAAEVGELARRAEAGGFDAVLIAERSADALALAHTALLSTERVRVGTAIANAAVRHPAMTAMTAATLAEESGGRFLLGLGVANPALNERVLGLPAIRPVQYMREYVGVLRAVLDGRPQPAPGDYFSVAGFIADRPTRTSVPIYVAGLLPKMLSLAAELADGVLLNLTTTAALPAVMDHINDGLARSGRTRSEIVVASLLPCCISSDAAAAARAAREVVAGYAMHPAAGKLFAASGFAEELACVRERLTGGDQNAAASVSDAMIDALVVHGGSDVLPGRIQDYRDAGVDLPVLFPMPVDDGWIPAIERVIHAASTMRTASTIEVTTPERKDAHHV